MQTDRIGDGCFFDSITDTPQLGRSLGIDKMSGAWYNRCCYEWHPRDALGG